MLVIPLSYSSDNVNQNDALIQDQWLAQLTSKIHIFRSTWLFVAGIQFSSIREFNVCIPANDKSELSWKNFRSDSSFHKCHVETLIVPEVLNIESICYLLLFSVKFFFAWRLTLIWHD